MGSLRWPPLYGAAGKLTKQQRIFYTFCPCKLYLNDFRVMDGCKANTVRAHPTPVQPRVLHKAKEQQEAAHAGLCGNAAVRQSLTYKLCRSAPDAAAAAVRRSILLVFTVLHSTHAGLSLARLGSPFTEWTSTTTPSGGGCAVRRTVAGPFPLIHIWDWGAESARTDLYGEVAWLAWKGGKERGKVYLIWCLLGRGNWCVHFKKGRGKRPEGWREMCIYETVTGQSSSKGSKDIWGVSVR